MAKSIHTNSCWVSLAQRALYLLVTALHRTLIATGAPLTTCADQHRLRSPAQHALDSSLVMYVTCWRIHLDI